jgi:HSP20 family protein
MAFRQMQAGATMRQLRREMDELLSGFLGNFSGMAQGPWREVVEGQPPIDLWETEDALFVELEVPGLKSDQVEVLVVGHQLTVKLNRPEPEGDGMAYHRRERPTGTFARAIELPVDVDAEKVEAHIERGVMTIRLPKAEKARPRKIQVNAFGS